jgi:hypothetical protein
MPGVFVSHAHADKLLVDHFVDDIINGGCGVSRELIFYSSGEDTSVPSGRPLNEYVRSEIGAASLVIAIISPTFQVRPYCIAELGAAWTQVGKLFPIAVPKFPLTNLEGVLDGVIVKHMDDSVALDELRDVVEEAVGVSSKTATWGRFKAKWTSKAHEYAGQIPTPRKILPADHDRALADLQGAYDALSECDSTIQDLNLKIELLRLAKDPAEAAEILLPKNEDERFQALVQNAATALNKLPRIVRQAVWFQLAEGEMPWPGPYDDHDRDEADAARRDGLLEETANERLRPCIEFTDVSTAVEAVNRLNDFLENETSEPFHDWFREEYKGPPELRHRWVWDALFSR